MTRIAVVMNICNEARHLRGALESVRGFADAVHVVDMESADGGGDIAREFGCRVIVRPREPVVEPSRAEAIRAADGDWVFVMDPDMRLSPETCAKLRAIAESGEWDAVDMCCAHHYFGFRTRYGRGSQPFYRKFFRKAAFQPASARIFTFLHDSVRGRVTVLPRPFVIEHYAYDSVEAFAVRQAAYARREAEELRADGVRGSLFRLLWQPTRAFLGGYVKHLGFLDGRIGFVLALLQASVTFQREIHLLVPDRGEP